MQNARKIGIVLCALGTLLLAGGVVKCATTPEHRPEAFLRGHASFDDIVEEHESKLGSIFMVGGGVFLLILGSVAVVLSHPSVAKVGDEALESFGDTVNRAAARGLGPAPDDNDNDRDTKEGATSDSS